MLFCKTPVWLWIVALLALWELAIICLGHVLLLYDFAPWRRLLIRDNQLTVRTLVNVIILGLALCNHSETKKKGETKCEVQSHTSVPVGNLLVCSSMVSFKIWSETGFIK